MQTIQELIRNGLNAVSDNHVYIRQKDRAVTALELKKDSHRIMRALIDKGAAVHDSVAVYADERIEMIKGMLGVLEAACVFVPIEGDYPAEMIRDMLEIAKVKCVLTDDGCYDKALKLRCDSCEILSLNRILADKEEADEEPNIDYDPEDPIYVYFTSGTTGKPKAILGKNKSLVHFAEWEGQKINKNGVSVSQITSPCHDPFLRDIFTTLFLQGKICIPADKNTVLDGRLLAEWVKEAKVNILHCTPGIVNHLLNSVTGKLDLPDLNYVFMAGEKINPKLLQKWYELTSGNARLVSLYGPTETTLAKLCYDIAPDDIKAEIVPLGKPIDDTDVYICDEKMDICDAGQEGEIVISTEYATYGYLNNDRLNETLFIKDRKYPGRIMYKTGDMGRVNSDGNIEFLGRKDGQIKIRGNRVELNFVESKILEMPGVKECVLLFNDETLGKEYIAAYVVGEKQCSKADIIDWLKTKVPSYMFPTYIVFMDKLPLNKNMKVDRKNLPDPVTATETQNEVLSETEELTATEEKLIEACKEILDTATVLPSDNFFALGGSSLNVMTLISRIYDDFQAEISLEEIFDSFSLADLAKVIDSKASTDTQFADSVSTGFSRFDYLEKKKAGYVFEVKTGGKTSNVIEGIAPFNDIFYRSCIYNSIFSVANFFGLNILPILTNDVVLYRPAEKLTPYEKMDFIEEKTIESVLRDGGVELKRYEVKDNVIQHIIDAIDSGKPVIVGVDCFYESIRTEFYLKENWPHNILVYGYDNATREMIVMEHTGINNLDYHEQRLSYLDLEYAYQSNRIKYPKSEDGRYYLECSKASENVGAKSEDFFGQYRETIKEHMKDIRVNLKELPRLIEYIEDSMPSDKTLADNRTWIARLLDAIVEAKKAQSYLLEKINAGNSEGERAPGILMDKILKRWKYARNALYKSIYSGEYDSEMMEDALNGLSDVKNLENDFYDSLVCQ